MSVVHVTIDGTPQEVPAGTTGTQWFQDRRDIVAMKIDGEPRDLFFEIPDGSVIESITLESPDGLNILRHSAAHVLAQAVQEVNPDVDLGIGPPITDGFYYDFGVEQPFTPEDLKSLEKAMAKIVKEGQTFRRRVVTEEEARQELADQPYKLELIETKSGSSDDDGSSVEVGSGELTIYDNVRKNGEVAWKDLCRGPHLPSTKLIGNGFGLTRSAAAYWRGSEKNPQLQRIYGTAWPTKAELKEYRDRIAEAERRDHRKLGNELDLFSFPDDIGSGLAVFHPKGGAVRMEMEDYLRRQHAAGGYEFVYTPHITKGDLFERSGHLGWYKDGMFPPLQVDATYNEETGEIEKPGADYYLKPMNCPMHSLIFSSRGRSYRDLPLRLFEFGTVYRYEKSGVVHGLTRARGFTQDDAHIYTTREQMREEIASVLTFILQLLRDYGLDDFYLELSTKNPEKFVGDDELWTEATDTLREVAEESGLELVDDPGGAAFYGPKISVQARDALGRTWQMSTIQLDFNTPERLDLEYTDRDGERKRPVMIHRALFGSIERFFAVLVEHYGGAFPAWLAPVQVRCIPVADAFDGYLDEVAAQLRAAGVRVEVDKSDDRFGKKIRNASKEKVPFVLIAGGEDVEKNAVSFRFRDGSQENGVPKEEAISRIIAHIQARRNDDEV
ncbi:threonine--tRNA ligase [Actinomycetaceae bacterium WB03_NA08]|uniref:Threonine--tRNA ligase n=1 Tax=Scrofimicrobium canadense TaxID=2652290 RepID=A0A6N7W4V7_9ACTO|nr:threonine--tRNA ligase [Scrofimicrobium canadense]MSS83492.1 threonine--tRNA ligase [Scrofimicrobium canadense]